MRFTHSSTACATEVCAAPEYDAGEIPPRPGNGSGQDGKSRGTDPENLRVYVILEIAGDKPPKTLGFT